MIAATGLYKTNAASQVSALWKPPRPSGVLVAAAVKGRYPTNSTTMAFFTSINRAWTTWARMTVTDSRITTSGLVMDHSTTTWENLAGDWASTQSDTDSPITRAAAVAAPTHPDTTTSRA